MDLTLLTPEEFELLCARLLQAEGYAIQRQDARARDIGVDFAFTDEKRNSWVAEVKHLKKQRTGTSILRRMADQLKATRTYLSVDRALLIISMMLPAALKNELSQREGIAIWDETDIRRLLNSHREVQRDWMTIMEARGAGRRRVTEEEQIDDRAAELIKSLDELPAGQSHWRQFEDLCIELLNYSLIGPFGVPTIQSRSEDNLDIRDAVYPIGSGHVFWDDLKRMCATRSAVAEFKNFSVPITQKEVESVQQYLFRKAMRMFGLLCSRSAPSDSAVRARRRAWMEQDKLIVLLSDEDMKDMVRARSLGEDPATVIDAQLDEFFLHLAP